MSTLDDELKSLLEDGRHEDVIRLYESRPADSSATPELRNLYACALIMAEKCADAFDILKAIPDTQKNPDIWNNLLLAGLELERFEETLALADAALAHHPNKVGLLVARARCLGSLDRAAEAYEAARTALNVERTDDAYCAAGVAAEQLGKYDEAFTFYRRALAINPDEGGAGKLLNDICWRLRRFAEVRDVALARQKAPPNRKSYTRYFSADGESWTGQPLHGRHLHVIGDQGVGDQIMFTQFVTRLPAFGPARVTVHLESRLLPLFRAGFHGDLEVDFQPLRDRIDSRPADAKVALSSLPNFLVRSIDDFARTPFLALDPGDGDFRGGDGRPVFGLGWWSTGLWSDTRSLDVDEIADALLTTDARFLSLQYRPADAGLDRLKERLGDRLIVAEGLDCTDDFLGVAKVCLRLDGILTIPQALVHVAGAVGAPTGVLLPPNPSWRYDGPDDKMLWYGDHVRVTKYEKGQSLENRVASCLSRMTRQGSCRTSTKN